MSRLDFKCGDEYWNDVGKTCSTVPGKNKLSLTSAPSLSPYSLAFPPLSSSCQISWSRVPSLFTAFTDLWSYLCVHLPSSSHFFFQEALPFPCLTCQNFSLILSTPSSSRPILTSPAGLFFLLNSHCILHILLVLILIIFYIVVTFVHVWLLDTLRVGSNCLINLQIWCLAHYQSYTTIISKLVSILSLNRTWSVFGFETFQYVMCLTG